MLATAKLMPIIQVPDPILRQAATPIAEQMALVERALDTLNAQTND